MATKSKALEELELRISAAELEVARAKEALDGCDPGSERYSRKRVEITKLKEDLQELHYKRRRLERFEGTGSGDL